MKKKGILYNLRTYRTLYLMISPIILYFIILSYLPMLGSLVAFKQYNIRDGLFFSPWCGLNNFKFFFLSGKVWLVLWNTVFFNTIIIVTSTVLQVTVAIFLAELSSRIYRKVMQSFMFLPYFISWVVGASILYNLTNYDYGIVNGFLKLIGAQLIDISSNDSLWKYIIPIASNWKWLGYGSLLYLAAIMGIDNEMYEAADIDGASIFSKIRNITLPMLTPTVIILTLLNIGRIFRGDFDMFYQLIGSAGNLYDSTDVIDTFVFRSLLQSSDIGMSAAAAFLQSCLCFVTIIVTNSITKKINKENALF